MDGQRGGDAGGLPSIEQVVLTRTGESASRSVEQQRPATSRFGPSSAISAPVLIVHGRSDELVDIRHAERFEAALRKAGVEAKTLYFDEEGHGLTKKANSDRMIHETLAFLKTHLTP